MRKIVVLDGFSVNPGDLSWEGLDQFGAVTVYDRTAPDEVIERCEDAEIILTNKVALMAGDIARLPKCRYIGVLATGYNVVDLKAASEHGITVTNIPAYSTASVAQNAFALLLTITNHAEDYARRNREDDAWVVSKDFCYYDTPLIELAGKRMGIVGFGHTGQAVARIARAFGMDVSVVSSKPQEQLPEVRKTDMDSLFRDCDVISLNCPLADDTYHLVDEKRLEMMKPTAILINTGRGPLVDEDALARALNSGRIFAAGVDVLSVEPPKYDNPLLSARNCYVTPHISWATKEARSRLIDIALGNIADYLDGKPCNKVN